MPERHLGRTLGRYRVDAIIGSGGFAWVYRGFDPDLEIPVALKVLKPQFAGDPEFEARFRREASTAARLRHPNIVTIYAVGREGDAVYFAMDYLPQGLAQRLEVSPTLPEPMLVRLGLDVARALAFAHRAGVVHRDIKADNILFDEHGNAIVVDFGIARAATEAARETRTNVVVGTPQYFAPEQARGRPVDGRTDIYALGVTLFRAATGRLPFDGEDWYAIARQHLEEPPPRPRDLNPAISEAFEAIILRMLEKRPEDRFQTADELAAALAPLAGSGADVGALPTVTVPVVPEPASSRLLAAIRRRRVALLAGAAGVGIVTLLALTARPDAVPTPPRPRPDDRPMLAALPPLYVQQLDSLADSTISQTDPTRPRRATLHVSAPGATILVDGRRVATDEFHADTMAPGEHVILAQTESIAGCPYATVVERVTLSRTTTRRLELAPRPCGRVRFTRVQAGTHYRLVGPLGLVLEGEVPLDRPIVVPAGDYELVLTNPACETYGPELLQVPPATDERPWVNEFARLTCGSR